MKSTIILFIITVLAFCSCSKTNSEQKEEASIADTIFHEFYQKDIPYSGFKGGHIDSVISKRYSPNLKEMISKEIKHYSKEGYIVSNETKSYNSGELVSAEHISYTRDQNSLVSSQIVNYLTNRGTGYTKQYRLVSRELNEEIWEYINKMSNQTLSLTAEVRKYSERDAEIFSQVGNTDSTTLSVQYIYTSKGLISDIHHYNNNQKISSIQTTYNKYNLPSQTTQHTLSENAVKATLIENFEYLYDDNFNPIEIKIYQNNEITSIIENTIHYSN